MSLPWLLRTAAVAALPEACLRSEAIRHLGEAAACLADQPWPGPVCHPPPRASEAWRAAVAVELLLAKAGGASLPAAAPEAWAASRPFGADGPCLGGLWAHPAAAAVIPLDGGAHEPDFSVLFVVQDQPQALGAGHGRKFTEFKEGFLPAGHKLFALTSHLRNPESITGTSWQLGAALALHALQENDPAATRKLYEAWLVTGEVDGQQIRSVDLGNKSSLHTARTWLLPCGNQPLAASPQQGRHPRSKYAPNLATAWNHITGLWSREGGRVEWAERAGILHLMAGKSITPMVSTALSLRPERACFWHSELSRRHAHTAAQVIQHFLPDLETSFCLMPSASLAEAERALRAGFLDHPEIPGRQTFISITGGNRIMSFAGQALAKANPQIRLIYRDIDAKLHEFILLHYEEDNPTTLVLAAPPDRDYAPPPNWPRLFGREPKELEDSFEPHPWLGYFTGKPPASATLAAHLDV